MHIYTYLGARDWGARETPREARDALTMCPGSSTQRVGTKQLTRASPGDGVLWVGLCEEGPCRVKLHGVEPDGVRPSEVGPFRHMGCQSRTMFAVVCLAIAHIMRKCKFVRRTIHRARSQIPEGTYFSLLPGLR